MNQINYDDILSEYNPVKSKQGHHLAPKWPFRLIIVGPSGCGKTHIMLDLILKMLYFDSLRIFAKDTSEDKYQMISDLFLKEFPREGLKVDFSMTDELDLPDIDTVNKTKQHLFIFDDMILEKDQSAIETLFIRGRKKNISTIYISQLYFDIPKKIRLNATHLIVFKMVSKKEVVEMAKDHACDIEKKKFYDLYNDCVNRPYGFIFLDKVSQEMIMRYRCGFDGLADGKLFL